MARGNDERHNPSRRPMSRDEALNYIMKTFPGSEVVDTSKPSYYPSFLPRLRSTLSNLYDISDDDAMGVLDAHRNKVDLGDAGYEGYDPSAGPLIEKLGTSNPSEAIEDAFKNRRRSKGSLDNTRSRGTYEPPLTGPAGQL